MGKFGVSNFHLFFFKIKQKDSKNIKIHSASRIVLNVRQCGSELWTSVKNVQNQNHVRKMRKANSKKRN